MMLISSLSQAIIRRHDLTDSEYIQDESANASIVRWSGCTSTLIAEKWVLTAAHCVLGDDGTGRDTSSYIDIFGTRYQLDGLPITHPEYVSVNRAYFERFWDIALLKLQQPVLDVEPLNIYEYEDELDRPIELWGFGLSGDGIIGRETTSNNLRKGTNIVNQVTNHELFMSFTHPNGTNVTEFECHIGNGDSGGPAIIMRDGEKYVAGIGSTADQKAGEIFKYGSESVYERVSANLGWLKLEMEEDYPGDYNGPLYQPPVNNNLQSSSTENPSGGGSFNPILILCLLSIKIKKALHKYSD